VIDNTLGRTLRFLYDGSYEEFRKIDRIGRNSYSKYISRDVTPEDAERYKTIYAKKKELLQRLPQDCTFLNIY
jgi:S-adenosylmethionine:tRNA ribosyltransferase-isomerase